MTNSDSTHFALGDAELLAELFCGALVANVRTIAGQGPKVWISRWDEGLGTTVYVIRGDGSEVAQIDVPDHPADPAVVREARNVAKVPA